MYFKILKKDFLRKKSISITLLVFISLSTLLIASGTNMIMEFFNSMNYFFEKSDAPHFVQTNAGKIDQARIDAWASSSSLVKKQQTVEMLNIDGSNVYLGNSSTSEKASVMDFDFVTQNMGFDFLLDLDSQRIQVTKGEIAVPVYFMQQNGLKIGDRVRISNQSFDMEFKITAFARDILMNPSIISSKRFVVSKVDYDVLKGHLGENLGQFEYLIEFQLKDKSMLRTFSNEYASSGLPQKGTPLDDNLLRVANILSDGLMATVIILVSFLLIVIALLCLRFTILGTIEEDYREIGVMKAIGLPPKAIKKIYMTKYTAMSVIGGLIGFLASQLLNGLFISNIALYMGIEPMGLIGHLIPFSATVLIILFIIQFCRFILRRFKKISAVEALVAGNEGGDRGCKKVMSLHKSRLLNVHVLYGIRDVIQRLKIFSLLFFIFLICSFMIIVPLNFLNTVRSPQFTSYLGVGRSDIRIDLQQSEKLNESFAKIVNYIKSDKDVERYASFTTYKIKMISNEGSKNDINVETGDFSVFPLEYLDGKAPSTEKEIALSYMNAKEQKKAVGDSLKLISGGEEKEMKVSGIYQDVTNGGKTAKARFLPARQEDVLRYVIGLDVKDNTSIDNKIKEYSKVMQPAKVTNIQGYLDQTFGNVTGQLKVITILAIIISILVSILIAALFLKMLIAKDYSQIAIMRGIGLTIRNIQVQYITRTLLVLNSGIIIGTIFSNTLGQCLISSIFSLLGASRIKFVINPLEAYVICPLVLMAIVSITTLVSIKSINNSNITQMILE